MEQPDAPHWEPRAELSPKLLAELLWPERVRPGVVLPSAPESSPVMMKPVTILPEAQRRARERQEWPVGQRRARPETSLPTSRPEVQPQQASRPEDAQGAASSDAVRPAPQLPCAA